MRNHELMANKTSRFRSAVLLGVGALVVIVAVVLLRPDSHDPNFNSSDVMFAQMMLPHHLQAIAMSEMVTTPGRNASLELQTLAQGIRTQQSHEVRALQKLLRQWRADADGGHHVGMMEGLLTDSQMGQLDSLRGAQFDHEWALAMIRHHNGAIAMAKDVVATGVNKKVASLANDIVIAQKREIHTLRKIANASAN